MQSNIVLLLPLAADADWMKYAQWLNSLRTAAKYVLFAVLTTATIYILLWTLRRFHRAVRHMIGLSEKTNRTLESQSRRD